MTKKSSPIPAQASTPEQFQSKPCNPTVSQTKSLGANYVTTKDGGCVPTGCMSGFVKNLEGQCVVMRKYNWFI